MILIHGERIPAHKSILAAKSEYYRIMFYGSLPEGDEINMNEANISAETFKEFLKLIYIVEPILTVDNIEGVINMAKMSLSDEILTKCEIFLKNLIAIDTTLVFRLALLYESENSKMAICLHAESVLKSSSFLKLPFEYFQMIIEYDLLVCEEKDIFIACIDWAKAACTRNNLDPLNAKNLRNQLQDSVHQIRFTLMTKEEASICIALWPGLFTINELQEIICMVGHNDAYQPKVFNWNPRRLNFKYNKNRQIQCSRFWDFLGVTMYPVSFMMKNVKNIENTRFTCNQRVFLHSFSSALNRQTQTRIKALINEISPNGDISELYTEHLIARYEYNPYIKVYESNIPLNKAILIRPNYTYDIWITFEHQIHLYRTYNKLKAKVRADHDIVFNFKQDGVISDLSFSRFNDKNYLQKIIKDPTTWFLTASICYMITHNYCFRYCLPKIPRLIGFLLFDFLGSYAFTKIVYPKLYNPYANKR